MTKRSLLLGLLALLCSATAAEARAGRTVSDDCGADGDDSECDTSSGKSTASGSGKAAGT